MSDQEEKSYLPHVTPLGEDSKVGSVRTQRSHKKRKLFLKFLAETGQVKKAAEKVGLRVQTLRTYYHKDPKFAEEWDRIQDTVSHLLESEAVRRGVEGTLKDIYHKGAVVGQERQYSDKLLEILLKANNREKFGDTKKVQIEGGFGIAVVPATSKNEDEWARQAAELTESQEGAMDEIVQGDAAEILEGTYQVVENNTGDKNTENSEKNPAKGPDSENNIRKGEISRG